jgi:uncharacterized protein
MSNILIDRTAKLVKEKFLDEGSGHDWWHIYRVWQNAKQISKSEDVDREIVELAALLHDIADYKFYDGDEKIGGETAARWLQENGANDNLIEAVRHIVDNISFKGGGNGNKMQTLEGKVVQDADRLDAIGAIGIARAFAYGGNKGVPIHDPNTPAKVNMTKKEYINNKDKGTSVNHFYEKLLKLRDLMNTETGRKIATERHEFMQKYLEQFYAEWEGHK